MFEHSPSDSDGSAIGEILQECFQKRVFGSNGLDELRARLADMQPLTEENLIQSPQSRRKAQKNLWCSMGIQTLKLSLLIPAVILYSISETCSSAYIECMIACFLYEGIEYISRLIHLLSLRFKQFDYRSYLSIIIRAAIMLALLSLCLSASVLVMISKESGKVCELGGDQRKMIEAFIILYIVLQLIALILRVISIWFLRKLSCLLQKRLERRQVDYELEEIKQEKVPELEQQSYSKFCANKASDSPSQKCETCCVCLEQFKDECRISILQCTHYFHNKCISNWLKHQNVCPLCKVEL